MPVNPLAEVDSDHERTTVMVRVNSVSGRDDRTTGVSTASPSPSNHSTREPVSRVGSERRPMSTSSSYVRPLSQRQPSRLMPMSRGDAVDVTRAMSASSRGGMSSRGIGSSASARFAPDWLTGLDMRRDEPTHSNASTAAFIAGRVAFVLATCLVMFLATGSILESDLVNNGQVALVSTPYEAQCVGATCLAREFTPSLQVVTSLSAAQVLLEFDSAVEFASAACSRLIVSSCADAAALLASYPSEVFAAKALTFVSSAKNCSGGSQYSSGSVPIQYSDAATGCAVRFVLSGANTVAMSTLRLAAAGASLDASAMRASLVASAAFNPTTPQYPPATSSGVQNTIVDIQFWPVPIFTNAQWPSGIGTAAVLEALGLCLLCLLWLIAYIASIRAVQSSSSAIDQSLKELSEAAAVFANNNREDAENPTLGPTRTFGNSMLASVRLSSALSGLRSNLSTPATSIHPQSRGMPLAPGLGALRSPSPAGLSRMPLMPLVRVGSMHFGEAEAAAKSLQAAIHAVDGVASYVPMALSFGGDANSGWASSIDFFTAAPGGVGFQTIGDDNDGDGDGDEVNEEPPDSAQSQGLVVFDVQQTAEAEAVRSGPSSTHTSFRDAPSPSTLETARLMRHNSGPPPSQDNTLARVPTPQNSHLLSSDEDMTPLESAAKPTATDKPPLAFSPLVTQHSAGRLKYSPQGAGDTTYIRGASGSPKSPRAFPDGVASPPPNRLVESHSFLGASNLMPAAMTSVAQLQSLQSLRRASALAFTMPLPYEEGSAAGGAFNVVDNPLRQKLCTVLHCQLFIPTMRHNSDTPSAFMVSMLQAVSHEFHEVTMRIAALFDGIVVSFGVDFVCFSWNGFSPYQFHEARACQCALHIEHGLRTVIDSVESWRICHATFGMCVATGQSVVGGVSANGTPYPVLCGENVILARRGAELSRILQCTTLVLEDTYVVAKSQVAGIPRDTIGTGHNRTVVFELKSTEPVSPRGLHSEYIAAFSKLKQGLFGEAAEALQSLIEKAGDATEPAFTYALRVAEYCCENPGEIQMFNQQSGIVAAGRATLFRRLPTWLIHEIQAMELEESSEDSMERLTSAGDTDRESIEAPSTEPRTSRPAAAPASELTASPTLQDAVARGLRMSRARDEGDATVTISVDDADGVQSLPETNVIEIDGERWTRGDRVLGSGANGTVRLAMSSLGSLSAMKFIPLATLGDDVQKALSEVAILSNLRHESIVGYISSAVVGSDLVVVLEYCGGGTLARLISLFGALPTSILQRYSRGILRGLNFLHKHGVTHRDLSLGNVLVTIDGECKLSDFGASVTRSTHKPMAMGNVLGTPAFMAPETCLGQVSMMSDVWSFGIMLCWMASGRAPYDEHLLEKPVDFLRRLASDPEFGPLIPAEVRSRPLLNSLVEACLQRSVIDRPWAETLLAHPFFLS